MEELLQQLTKQLQLQNSSLERIANALEKMSGYETLIRFVPAPKVRSLPQDIVDAVS